MNINLKLSDTSIDHAISKLKDILEVIESGVGEIVDILVTDGEMVANEAYGGMATAWGHSDESTENGVAKGHIGVTAKTPDAAIIAEFGAGYSTMEYHPMAQALETQTGIKVEVGSYSRENDGLFALTDSLYPGEGYWIFGWTFGAKGKMGSPNFMDRVQPRHGLLNARDFIVQNSTNVAEEVLQFD